MGQETALLDTFRGVVRDLAASALTSPLPGAAGAGGWTHVPVVWWPHIDQWWLHASDQERTVTLQLLDDAMATAAARAMQSSQAAPLLLLATADQPWTATTAHALGLPSRLFQLFRDDAVQCLTPM